MAFLNRQLVLVAVTLLFAATDALPGNTRPFSADLESIVKRELPSGYSISIQVADLETGRVYMEKDPDLALAPASTMKVVTAATALHTLNPEFTFVTEVWADGVRDSSVGNLFLKGYGDPYLVSEELFALTRSLRERGLREVRGNVLVDDSYFLPSKPLDENEKLGVRAYHAPYSALSLNFNSIKIVAVPASRPGLPAHVFLDTPSEYATVEGTVQTVNGSRPGDLAIHKEPGPDDREVIRVEGSIGVEAPIKPRRVNVVSPALYFGDVFKEFLLREGIRVTGKVIHGKVPQSASLYYEFNSSRPLAMIVYGLNKFSNNFMAEQICMAMGAKVHGAPGTREKGLSVIRDFLVASGVDDGKFSLAEASGLSRTNRISASALVRVLLRTYKDFHYGPEFVASLGVGGVDGTMKEKFTDQGAKRRIRAKTGNLRGVNSLAGYGVSPDGRAFVFAVLVNSVQKGTGFIDFGEKIIRAVMDLPLGKAKLSDQRSKK